MMRAAVFTINTDLYNAKRQSGAADELKRVLRTAGFEVRCGVLPADKDIVKAVIERLTASKSVSLIVTAGCAGIRRGDFAPGVVEELSDMLLPGIAEALRAFMRRSSKKALLNRSCAGVRGRTVLLCVPENDDEVGKGLEYIAAGLVRAAKMLSVQES